jgi:threonine dehydrogenase-like Zn-dependent dehydrogenase
MDKIEFSIISRGTEKEGGSKGYMAVTEFNKGRYIIPIPHGIIETACNTDCLRINDNISIEKIAFSRFQLISAIMYKKNANYFNKEDKILVIGSGSVGFTTCMELARQKHKNIFLLLKKDKNIKTNIFREAYGINLKLESDIKKIKNFNYLIDASGDSDVLREITDLCAPFSTIIILGTPRKNPAIDSLIIHRKNLHIIGSHEIIGIDNNERNNIFNEILIENKKYPQYLFSEISHIEDYSEENRVRILKDSPGIINIMRYLKNDN